MTSTGIRAALMRERGRLTRAAQGLVGAEAALLGVLAGYRMLARDATASTVLAAGFRLGPIPCLAALTTEVALLATPGGAVPARRAVSIAGLAEYILLAEEAATRTA